MAYRRHERWPIHTHVQRALAVQHRLVVSVARVLFGGGCRGHLGWFCGRGPFECSKGHVGSTHAGGTEHFETVVLERGVISYFLAVPPLPQGRLGFTMEGSMEIKERLVTGVDVTVHFLLFGQVRMVVVTIFPLAQHLLTHAC